MIVWNECGGMSFSFVLLCTSLFLKMFQFERMLFNHSRWVYTVELHIKDPSEDDDELMLNVLRCQLTY